MVYRTACKNDIDELVRIRMSYIEEDFGENPEEKTAKIIETLPFYFEKHLGNDLFVFIAENENHIISSAMLAVIEKPANPTFPTGKFGNILNVYTERSYRRKGIATKVLKNLLDYSKELNLDFIELKATEDGYPLYKKLGFTERHSSYREMKYFFNNLT